MTMMVAGSVFDAYNANASTVSSSVSSMSMDIGSL